MKKPFKFIQTDYQEQNDVSYVLSHVDLDECMCDVENNKVKEIERQTESE